MYIKFPHERMTVNLAQWGSWRPLDLKTGAVFNGNVLAQEMFLIEFIGSSGGNMAIAFPSAETRDGTLEQIEELTNAHQAAFDRATGRGSLVQFRPN